MTPLPKLPILRPLCTYPSTITQQGQNHTFMVCPLGNGVYQASIVINGKVEIADGDSMESATVNLELRLCEIMAKL